MKAENFYESFNGRNAVTNLSALLNSTLSSRLCSRNIHYYVCILVYGIYPLELNVQK